MSSKLTRLADLEKHFGGDGEIVLTMADGSEVSVRGDTLGLFTNAIREHQAGRLSPTIDLIRCSVSSREPGGGHMVELVRAVLNSSDDSEPAEPEPSAPPPPAPAADAKHSVLVMPKEKNERF